MRLLVAAFLSISSLGHAQPTPAEPTKSMLSAAQRYSRDGMQFAEEGNYSAARASFEAGYSLSREPDFLHNLSWIAERQGQLAEAIAFAERYLTAKPDADNAERTRRRIAMLRSRLGQSAPEPKPPETKAPEPTRAPLTASQAQPEPTRAPPTAPQAQSAVQNASSGPTSPEKPAQQGRMTPGAIGLLAGGGVLALVGAGLLVGAWATGVQTQSQGVTFEEWSSLSDRGQALNAGGISLLTVGGAAMVGGAVWTILGWNRR